MGEASNGDLAEADQSHHTLEAINDDSEVGNCDGDSEADRDCAAEGSMSASGSEPTSSILHGNVFQPIVAPEAADSELEVEALQDEGGVMACAGVDGSGCRTMKV